MIQHPLGSRNPSGEFAPQRVVNLAGSWFTSAYPWAWLERPATGLDFVAGQSYVTLPTDFSEFRSVEVAELLSSFTMTTSAEINYLRSSTVDASGLCYWGAINYDADAVPRLDIYPTPGSNQTDALNLYYRGRWVDLQNDTDRVKIPPWCEPAFVDVLRAFALGYEEDEKGSVSRRLAEIKAGTLADAIAQDGRVQTDYGEIQGGAVANDRVLVSWSGFTVADPS